MAVLHDTLSQILQALVTGLGEDLVAVVLFGSRARGDARPDSDWDLLVIAQRLPARTFERHVFFRRLLPPGPAQAASILARTPDEFESHLPSLYLDIALDGQILYDPSGYASERLGSLRKQIEKTGLYRERSAAGDVWRCRESRIAPWPRWGE